MKPRFHDDAWWAYDTEYDSDTGPYSSKEQAQEWIDEIRPTDKELALYGKGVPKSFDELNK